MGRGDAQYPPEAMVMLGWRSAMMYFTVRTSTTKPSTHAMEKHVAQNLMFNIVCSHVTVKTNWFEGAYFTTVTLAPGACGAGV